LRKQCEQQAEQISALKRRERELVAEHSALCDAVIDAMVEIAESLRPRDSRVMTMLEQLLVMLNEGLDLRS
jgi:hypothetical protein